MKQTLLEIKNLLELCDKALCEISVKGGDVFLMAGARRYLKSAYDEILKERSDETTIPTKCE